MKLTRVRTKANVRSLDLQGKLLDLPTYYQENRCYWWLARVILVAASGFCPKILGGTRHLQMVLCHSMNAGSVVEIP